MENSNLSSDYIVDLCENYDLDDYEWVVYILRSVSDPNLMYCGSTNNIRRRLRQHNRLISGGAKYTAANGPWRLAALITDIDSRSQSLKVEYWTKAKNYPNKRGIPRDCPVKRRVYLIKKSMAKHHCREIIYIDDEFRKMSLEI